MGFRDKEKKRTIRFFCSVLLKEFLFFFQTIELEAYNYIMIKFSTLQFVVI